MIVNRVAFALAVTVAISTPALAVDSSTARRVWVAFDCAGLAQYFDDDDVAQDFFDLGLREGRELLEALNGGKADNAMLLKDAPWGLNICLGGPSVDFMLGRLFQCVSDYTSETVIKNGLDGLPLEEGAYDFDEELQSVKAKTLFGRANCELLME